MSFAVLQTRERLRIGKLFLRLRPRIAAVGALGNAWLLHGSTAPARQKLVLGATLGATIAAFFAEAWWLERSKLSERWLLASLGSTLLGLAIGAGLSGGLTSP